MSSSNRRFLYIANFSSTKKGTSFAIILEISSLLHTHTARAKKRPHVASAKSAQHPVIIQTSANSANFGITRFKSNRRNSTECRFSASGADNTCRSGANQRKMSRQEASSHNFPRPPLPYFIRFFPTLSPLLLPRLFSRLFSSMIS